MAGDWMKIELELPDKPEVHSIANTLEMDSDCVVGKLVRVWQWFDKHTTNGNALGVTYSLLDRITGVTGFGEAMIKVGWIEQNDNILTMPKFDRHTSASAKTRALTNKRVLKIRNGASVTLALPEKRREEFISNTKVLLVSNDVANCPHDEIIKLYAKHLPMLSQVKIWSEARAKHLKARWREDLKRQKLDYWERFFAYVGQSDFLTGRNGQWLNCDLAWLVKSENFIKVLEGKYQNKEAGNG